jgi:signal transduction histidine kinase
LKSRVKLSHITLLSFFLVAGIVIVSGTLNYISHRNAIIENFVSKHTHEIQEAREYYRLKLDKLQHDFILKESANIRALMHLYERHRKEGNRFDIDKTAQVLNQDITFGTYQAFVINRNYVIEKSSYAPDLGYDLGQHKLLIEVLDSIFNNEKSVDVSPIQIDSSSMQFKRYLLKLSSDKSRLLQIAFVLNFDELAKGSMLASRDESSFKLYLANDNLIQPIYFNETNLDKKSLSQGWEQTKTFLMEMSEALSPNHQKNIVNLLKLDIAADRLRINEELDRLFADEKIIHSLDFSKNRLSIYSITNSLFNKGSETKLILKAHYPIDNLEHQLNSATYRFILPLALSLLVLWLIYAFLVRNILNPLLKIMSDLEDNRRSDVDKSIITEIISLRDSYNRLHDRLNSEIATNTELLKFNRRCIADTIHQIKTPLTNIMMNGEMIKKAPQGDALAYYIDRIDSSINMLSNSYDDLAYVISCDTFDYPPATLNLSLAVKKRIMFFTTISEVTHKKINQLVDDDDLFISINEIELERIIDNNLSNAIKYADMHQPITVSLTRTQQSATLEFASHGREIFNKDKVFDEGYREDTGKRGLGLGLSMVKGICTKYGIAYQASYAEGQNVFAYQFPISMLTNSPEPLTALNS